MILKLSDINVDALGDGDKNTLEHFLPFLEVRLPGDYLGDTEINAFPDDNSMSIESSSGFLEISVSSTLPNPDYEVHDFMTPTTTRKEGMTATLYKKNVFVGNINVYLSPKRQ